jgi:hypothetical protein
MPTPLDLLNAPEFADDRLTESINIPPYVTGRPAQLGLFRDTPIHTTFVKMGISGDEITIIPSRERGGPANKNMRNDRQTTYFEIPHFPLDDAITPADLQNLTVFGDGFVMQTLANVVNEKLTTMRSKHDATHNHLDWGALNGQVIDAAGVQLVDLYDQFDLTQDTENFALGTPSTDVAAKNRTVKAAIRKQLRGAPSTGVRVFASPEWFDAYVNHATVKDAYKYYAAAGQQQNPARDDITDGFTHAGLTLERIDEEFSYRQENGTFATKLAVPAGEALAVPLGTPYFKRYVAPPDTIQDANKAPAPGSKIFVSTDDLPHGKGRDVHTESNILPVCLRPQIIIRLTNT